MKTIEEKAHEVHNANRALQPKYHIPYICWIDWFTLGYRRAEKDTKQKAIEAYKKSCDFNAPGCCNCKNTKGECDCEQLEDFIAELDNN